MRTWGTFILLTVAILAVAQGLRSPAFIGSLHYAESGGTPAFSPTDVGGLKMWYKASTVITTATGFVTNWPESSGNGYALINTSANQEPQLTNQASRINAKPYLKFDGVDDILRCATPASYSQINTIFIAGELKYVSALGFHFDSTNSSVREATYVDASTNYILYAGSESGCILGRDAWYLFEITFNGTSCELHTNGASVKGAIINAGTGALDGLTVGSRYNGQYYFAGGIAEVLFYNTNVSLVNRTNIRGYFTNIYGPYASW